MKKPIIAAATVALCAVYGPAFAAQEGASSAVANNEQSSSTEIVCRRLPPPVGTRIGARRVCKTAMEWAIIDRENRTMAEQAFNRSKMQNNEH